MTEAGASPPKGVVLTVEDVGRLKGKLRLLNERVGHLLNEQDIVQKRLDAASLFLDLSSVAEIIDNSVEAITAAPVPPIAPVIAVAPSTTAPTAPARRRRGAELTWGDVVMEGIEAAEMGLSYAEMRQYASSSPLGEKLKLSDKGYHNAISRLAKSEEIVREHGRLFTHAAFERFMRAVNEGKASTVVPMPFVHSPMGEAILKIVANRPGITGKEIIGELRKDVEFNATLTPHETGAFNIIARLVKRRQIIRRDDGGCVPGPEFPKELIERKPDAVGALNGQAASAPVTGESGNFRLFSNP